MYSFNDAIISTSRSLDLNVVEANVDSETVRDRDRRTDGECHFWLCVTQRQTHRQTQRQRQTG
eukprot:COSAG02_NODE_38935_length_423_cov_0.641975_1_plen_62_part_10